MPNPMLSVLVNREGGAASAAGPELKDQIAAAFAVAGAEAEVHLLRAEEMADAIENAKSGSRRVVVAGGDGTIASAAQILSGGDTELAVLRLGTLNHFARDLGIPQELEEAAALAAQGTATKIDVASVNDRCFINNASIGLYPLMVKGRDAYRDRHGWPKWLASVPAAWGSLSRLRNQHLGIAIAGEEKPLVTPLLFVGNNRYSLDAGSVGSRESLQDGTLSVYAVARRSRASLIWFGIRAAFGKAHRARDFETLGECDAMTVRTPAGSIEIALDGEVLDLSGPLEFRLRPGALRVVIPA